MVNLYKWREEVNQVIMEESNCPSCKSAERNPAGSCHDCWHYYVPKETSNAEGVHRNA